MCALLFNTTRTVWVFHGDDLLVVVKVVQERCEDSPAGVEFVVTDEVGVVALQCVENERFVCLRNLQVGESPPVGKVEFCDDSLHAETGQLGVHLNVNTLVGLHSDDELVSWNVLEDSRGDILELNADLGLLLVESLSCLQDEGYTVPSLVLDVSDHRCESGASGVLGDCVILLVAWLLAVQRLSILSNDDVLGLDRGHATEDADLFVTDVFGREGDGSLHSEESKNLEQVCDCQSLLLPTISKSLTVLHDITNDAELVEVTSTAFGSERLLEGDLDVVDVVPVPGCAEELVTESENQDVLDHLLTQVVVNTVKLVLSPVWRQRALELSRTWEVLAEGLLDLHDSG